MFKNSMITIHGYIGKEVNLLSTSKDGKKFLKFSVSVTNENSRASQWYQVMVFGVRAEALIKENRIKQGYEAVVHGLHVYQPYIGKDKQTHYSNTVFSDFEAINKSTLSKKGLVDIQKVKQIDSEISDQDIEDMAVF